jgi:hypothetical protein
MNVEIIALRTRDWNGAVFPCGVAHDKCVDCGAVVLLHLNSVEKKNVSDRCRVLCLACAAIRGNQQARDLHIKLFGITPEEALRTSKEPLCA